MTQVHDNREGGKYFHGGVCGWRTGQNILKVYLKKENDTMILWRLIFLAFLYYMLLVSALTSITGIISLRREILHGEHGMVGTGGPTSLPNNVSTQEKIFIKLGRDSWEVEISSFNTCKKDSRLINFLQHKMVHRCEWRIGRMCDPWTRVTRHVFASPHLSSATFFFLSRI